MFLDVPVSGLGVFIAAIVYFVIGAIWYAPFLFGPECIVRHDTLDESHKKCPCKFSACIGEFITALIIAYVTAIFIQISQADEVIEGLTIAFWIWLGFIATTHFSAVLWGRKSIKHYFIHVGFMLVGLLAIGLVLTYFRV